MKNIILLFLSLLFLSSCAIIQVYDIKGVDPRLMPVTQEVYHNEAESGYKIGESCVTNILNLVANGDSSVEAAARNANITEISSISTKYNKLVVYLPFYQKGCTVVRGK